MILTNLTLPNLYVTVSIFHFSSGIRRKNVPFFSTHMIFYSWKRFSTNIPYNNYIVWSSNAPISTIGYRISYLSDFLFFDCCARAIFRRARKVGPRIRARWTRGPTNATEACPTVVPRVDDARDFVAAAAAALPFR